MKLPKRLQLDVTTTVVQVFLLLASRGLFFLMRQETSLDSQEQVEINCSFLFLPGCPFKL